MKLKLTILLLQQRYNFEIKYKYYIQTYCYSLNCYFIYDKVMVLVKKKNTKQNLVAIKYLVISSMIQIKFKRNIQHKPTVIL